MQTLVSTYMQKANFLTPTFHYGKSIYKLATEIILIFHFPVSIVKDNKSRYFSMFNLYKIHNTWNIYYFFLLRVKFSSGPWHMLHFRK